MGNKSLLINMQIIKKLKTVLHIAKAKMGKVKKHLLLKRFDVLCSNATAYVNVD